ncbi:MAG TPA: RusA family crossover junction endodeoxyribonuclease [Xanthobacteraceae bacterium]
MTPIVVIELAGEPRGKGRPRFVRGTGVAFTPSATRKHEAALRYAAQQEMNGRPPFDTALVITVVATFAVPVSWSKRKRADALSGTLPHVKAPDCDNLLKCVDALNGVTWIDDKQITRAVVIKQYGERPSLRIEISGAVS